MIKFPDSVFTALILGSCFVIGCKSDSPITQLVEAKPKEVSQVVTTPTEPAPHIHAEAAQIDTTVAENEARNQPISKEDIESKPNRKTKKTRSQNRARSAIEFKLIRYDFGTIVEGDTVDYNFMFQNTGKAPLEIDSTKVTCGCTQPSYPFMPIEVGEKGFIGVRYVSVGKEGAQEPLISVYTNASKEPISLMMTGKVIPAEQDSIIPTKVLTKRIGNILDSLKTTVEDSLKN